MLFQPVPGQHDPLILYHVSEKRKLLPRKLHLLPSAQDLPGIHVHLQVSSPVAGLRRLRRPAQEHPDPRQQLLHGKRLHQIIIRPRVQPLHTVLNTVFSRQEQHRRTVILPPHRPQDTQPVQHRHHNIQDHGIILRARQIIQSLLPIIAGIHTVVLRLQAVRQNLI